MNLLYKIEKLSCRYFDKKSKKFIDALVAEDIKIRRGEITIILGSSGSGKSTFMEAISLMSNTINAEGDASKGVIFYSNNGKDERDLVKSIGWSTNEINDLRLNEFCFIFQDTNIMENFNATQNVALPRMYYMPDTAITDSEQMLRNSLNLRINLDKPASSYSGGQKQRFSFARAFLAKGEVLFGDEPTGSLDKYNSENLFEIIRDYIKKISKDSETENAVKKVGAIIVTHNIELALSFADQIIVIVKPERIDDDNDDQKKEVITGYSNPFFTYQNDSSQVWRTDCLIGANHKLKDMLPPLSDDNSAIKKDPNKLNRDKLEKEIKFYLNNSYAVPQRLLVEIAKSFHEEVKLNSALFPDFKKKFDKIKELLIKLIEENAFKISIVDFEKQFSEMLFKLIGEEEKSDKVFNENLIELIKETTLKINSHVGEK